MERFDMHILHVITGLRKAAGTSTFCGEVCNQLAILGHDVTIAVCDPDASNVYPLDPRVHLVSVESILHYPPQPPPSTLQNEHHRSSTSTSNFDLIHLHGLWSPLLHRVARFARSHNIPVVWSTHGMTAPWALKHKWWKKFLPWHLYQKRDLQSANLIHCTSDFEVAWNRKLGFERAFLAPLGTFLPEMGADDGCRCRDEGRTLLFVGRIYPVKALNRLIEAFGKVMREWKVGQESCSTAEDSLLNWKLRIVGPDQAGHMAELMSFCEKLGLSYASPVDAKSLPHHNENQPSSVDLLSRPTFSTCPQVEFAGPKYGADLDAEYANCTALALVSHTENFGATVVDALAHGKPVVTSTKTPWKIVEDRRCGWWVDNDVDSLANAFAELFKCQSADLDRIGQNGRALVEAQFTWPAVARNVLANYMRMQ